jgi:heme/copper-type cytochrome/quinol oxidase subunit 4
MIKLLKMQNKNFLLKSMLFLLPNLTFAAGFDLSGFVGLLVDFINNTVVFLMFALAVIFFIYHLAKYIYFGNDQAKRKESREYIIYGIIVLTIMFSIYGVIQLVAITFGISNIGIPQFGR